MAGTANVIPAELVAVHDRVQAGDLAGAREAWARIHPYLDAALSTSYIAAVKAGLRRDRPLGGTGPRAAVAARPGRRRPHRAARDRPAAPAGRCLTGHGCRVSSVDATSD